MSIVNNPLPNPIPDSRLNGVLGTTQPSAGSKLFWDFSVNGIEINSGIDCLTEGCTSARYIPQDTSKVYKPYASTVLAYNRGVGLWSEDEATNLVDNSGTVTLLSGQASHTATTVAGMSGWQFTANTAAGSHSAAYLAVTTVGATNYTLSAIVETTERYMSLSLNGNDALNFATAVIDLQTGLKTDEDLGGTSGTVNSAKAVSLGGNLYRLEMNAQIGVSGAYVLAVSDSGTPVYTAAGIPSFTAASEVFSYAVPQIETTTSYSSPIPTSGSPVTRIKCATEVNMASCGLTFPTNDYDIVIKGKLNKIPDDGILFAGLNNTTPSDDNLAIFVIDSTTIRATHTNSATAATDIDVTVPAISPGDTFTVTLNKRSSGNSTLTWNATSASQSTNWNLASSIETLFMSAHGVLAGCANTSFIDVELHSVEVIDAS